MSNLAINLFYDRFSPRYNLTLRYTYYKQYIITYTVVDNHFIPLTFANQFKTLTQQPQPIYNRDNDYQSFPNKQSMMTFIINYIS